MSEADGIRLQASFRRLHELAWQSLEDVRELPPSNAFVGMFRRFKLWDNDRCFGCSGAPNSLTVFGSQLRDGRPPLVREVVWRSRIDGQRLREMVEQGRQDLEFPPTLSVRDAEVPAERLNQFLDYGQKLKIPLVWPQTTQSVSADCSTEGFEFFSSENPPAILKLQWSSATPLAWDPVKDWLRGLRQFLEESLPGGRRDEAPG
jgi:hypothetical protein